MTIENIIRIISNYPYIVLQYLGVMIGLSLIGLLFISNKNFKAPFTYLYSIIIYGVSVPGLLSIILIFYSVFSLHQNILKLDLVTYFIPPAAMLLTLAIINKTVSFDKIPGFERLSGLFILLAISLILTYVLQRMFFGVFFIGKISYLILFFVVIVFALRIAWARVVS
ncbi:MAG: hypothetical protein MK207_08370 [Saprospiraceae bacterium]|nr:hypothetical protein [Saprospiraceae bacterium]